MGEIAIVEADTADLSSLTTVVARSFFPVNPFIKSIFPDTAAMRQWWSTVFAQEIGAPDCHVLIARQPKKNTVALGVLTLRLLNEYDKGAGLWSSSPLTDDHNQSLYWPMIDGMSEHRERLMTGRKHFLLELFGVDQAYQGQRVGKQLLQRACDIADEAQYVTFVQANASARGIYEKAGFVLKSETLMPGELNYREFMLVRQPVPIAI